MTDLQTFVRWQDVDAGALAGRTVVVIDVLRWSTVVVTALANGAVGVEAFAKAEDAERRAAELRASSPHESLGVLLGGERATRPLPGFDLGNSPGDYTRERVGGRVIVTTTTNGTQAMAVARLAHEVLVAAFVNVDAVVAALRTALAAGRGVTLIGAGTEGVEAPEDTGCAGAIAAELLDSQAIVVKSGARHQTPSSATASQRHATVAADASQRHPTVAADAATQRAVALWETGARDPARLVGAAPHAAALTANGFAADVAYAARLSVRELLVVPILGNERSGVDGPASPAVTPNTRRS